MPLNKGVPTQALEGETTCEIDLCGDMHTGNETAMANTA